MVIGEVPGTDRPREGADPGGEDKEADR